MRSESITVLEVLYLRELMKNEGTFIDRVPYLSEMQRKFYIVI